MSEPTTEAGRDLLASAKTFYEYEPCRLPSILAIEAEARTLDADRLRAAWLEHRRKAPGGPCSPEGCATYIAAEYGLAPASQTLTLGGERLLRALKAVIELPTVVPDHPHGGVHPPYLEWVKVAAIVDTALGPETDT